MEVKIDVFAIKRRKICRVLKNVCKSYHISSRLYITLGFTEILISSKVNTEACIPSRIFLQDIFSYFALGGQTMKNIKYKSFHQTLYLKGLLTQHNSKNSSHGSRAVCVPSSATHPSRATKPKQLVLNTRITPPHYTDPLPHNKHYAIASIPSPVT